MTYFLIPLSCNLRGLNISYTVKHINYRIPNVKKVFTENDDIIRISNQVIMSWTKIIILMYYINNYGVWIVLSLKLFDLMSIVMFKKLNRIKVVTNVRYNTVYTLWSQQDKISHQVFNDCNQLEFCMFDNYSMIVNFCKFNKNKFVTIFVWSIGRDFELIYRYSYSFLLLQPPQWLFGKSKGTSSEKMFRDILGIRCEVDLPPLCWLYPRENLSNWAQREWRWRSVQCLKC